MALEPMVQRPGPRVLVHQGGHVFQVQPGVGQDPPERGLHGTVDHGLIEGAVIAHQGRVACKARPWSSFAGNSPLVGYHSAFDQAMIDRAMQAAFGRVLPNPWLDLEHVAALVHQDPRPRPLDHWLKRHGA